MEKNTKDATPTRQMKRSGTLYKNNNNNGFSASKTPQAGLSPEAGRNKAANSAELLRAMTGDADSDSEAVCANTGGAIKASVDN